MTLIGCVAQAKLKYVEVIKSLGKNGVAKGTLAEVALTYFTKCSILSISLHK